MATEKHAIIKVSDLSGTALDWAVVTCEHDDLAELNIQYLQYTAYYPKISPSTEWSHGGPIVEREKINIGISTIDEWMAFIYDGSDMTWILHGQTPLVAAMRCYVASKLGDTVEIPIELL